MTTDLMKTAEQMEQNLATCSQEDRLALQPGFSELIAQMQKARIQVPQRMKQLEASLSDEAIEARFDNMPV